MSAGNDFHACRAGMEFLSSVKNVSKELEEHNKIMQEYNELLAANNTLMKEQIDATLEVIETLKWSNNFRK